MKGLFCLFERRPIMEKKRKDSRGRVLRKGEAFRVDIRMNIKIPLEIGRQFTL